MDQLKLVALDRDDLDIVATHLQDAHVRVGDIHWRPQEKRLVMGLDRFDWEGAVCEDGHFRRRRTALRFDRVMACKCRNLECQAKDRLLNLLTIEFAETASPGGSVVLIFSGGGELRLDVECLEVELADLGPVWDTTACPAHVDQASPA